MTTATLNRDNLWEVTSRTIVYSAIGAALYGLLLVAQIPIPGTHGLGPTGLRARAVLRLCVRPDRRVLHGAVGNAIGDQISGWGALTSWNWSIANGLVGLIAGGSRRST